MKQKLTEYHGILHTIVWLITMYMFIAWLVSDSSSVSVNALVSFIGLAIAVYLLEKWNGGD